MLFAEAEKRYIHAIEHMLTRIGMWDIGME